MRVLTLFNLKKILFFITIFITSFLIAQEPTFTLVLDAGHGGHDYGAQGLYANEKEVNLSIVLKLGALIQANNKDVRIIYTRQTDEFIPLVTRADIANKNKADFFISIHCNSSSKSTPYGTETFVLGAHRNADNFNVAKRENEVIYMEQDYKNKYEGFNPSSPESIIGLTLMQNIYLENSLRMASSIENNFKEINSRFSRGVKQAGFLVLVQTAMPSVLIETGFISNYQEGKYLASEEGQNEIAQSIYKAFLNYKNEFDKKSGRTLTSNTLTTDINSSNTKIEETLLEDANKYKVQFLSITNKLPISSPQFKDFKNIEIVKINGRYIYYMGATPSKIESEKNLRLVNKVFKDAFIVQVDEKLATPKTFYTIEFFISPKKYKEYDPSFKRLKGIIRIKENNFYLYNVGKVTNYESAKILLANIKKLGFNDAVIAQISE